MNIIEVAGSKQLFEIIASRSVKTLTILDLHDTQSRT